MNDREALWLDHQRRRWMRPNAHHYIRHDAYRFMPAGSPLYVGRDVVKYFWPEPSSQPADSINNASRPGVVEWTGKRGRWMPDSDDASLELRQERELAEIRANLLELKSVITSVRRELAWRRFQDAFSRYVQVRLKAGFNPTQPRVPAGNSGGGQWTSGDSATNSSNPIAINKPSSSPQNAPPSSSPGLVISDAMPDSIRPGAQYAESRSRVKIDYSRALTGISQIDDTTKALSKTLGQAMENMDFIPEWTPQQYGTAVHVAFGTMVRFQGLPGIGFFDVEHSIFDREPADYGQPGSIRTDVVLRNDTGDIMAIYDVKTGGGTLTPARVREIREKTGVGPNVPIVELHVLRGAMLKGRVELRKIIGVVLARLWNPARQDNSSLVAAYRASGFAR